MSSLDIKRLLSLALMTASTQIGFLPHSFAYEAHEWGTFTSLVGSNGITQNGMYHEDEQLPQFVHPFGYTLPEQIQPPIEPAPPYRPPENPPQTPPSRPGRPCFKSCLDPAVYSANKITQKMETPVIYFYTDRPQRVSVNVRFPEGVITETYPAPVRTFPNVNDANLELKNGDTQFTVNVTSEKYDKIPFVESDNIYSHARNVDSNIVRAGQDVEKFIFYRGLGRFQPRLHISSVGNSLTISGSQSALPQAVFLVHVNQFGDGQMVELGKMVANKPLFISGQMINELKNHTSAHANILIGALAHSALVNALVTSGLHTDEAQAMVNTWEHGYLKVPGLRLLYVLPRSEVDEVLPLSMSPTPNRFVRSFVGRIEILLDSEEQQILSDIIHDQYYFHVHELGRFAEPILRRVSEVYREREANPDPVIVGLLNTLIGRVSVGNTDSSTTVH